MPNPTIPSMSADDLRALLAIDHALTRVAEAIDDANRECKAHPHLAGVPELLDILARVGAELDAADPADRLLPGRKAGTPILPVADDGITL